MSDFLSGQMSDPLKNATNEISNVWTAARKASNRLGVTWSLSEEGPRIAKLAISELCHVQLPKLHANVTR